MFPEWKKRVGQHAEAAAAAAVFIIKLEAVHTPLWHAHTNVHTYTITNWMQTHARAHRPIKETKEMCFEVCLNNLFLHPIKIYKIGNNIQDLKKIWFLFKRLRPPNYPCQTGDVVSHLYCDESSLMVIRWIWPFDLGWILVLFSFLFIFIKTFKSGSTYNYTREFKSSCQNKIQKSSNPFSVAIITTQRN